MGNFFINSGMIWEITMEEEGIIWYYQINMQRRCGI